MKHPRKGCAHDGLCNKRVYEAVEKIFMDSKELNGVLIMLLDSQRNIRFRKFADAEAKIRELASWCHSRLWPGTLQPEVELLDKASVLCPAAKNEPLYALTPVPPTFFERFLFLFGKDWRKCRSLSIN